MKIKIGISLIVVLVISLLALANMIQKSELKSRCYIHLGNDRDDDYPAKVIDVLDHGVIIQTKKIRYGDLEVNQHYELMETFEKDYKIADCYMWDATEQPIPKQ